MFACSPCVDTLLIHITHMHILYNAQQPYEVILGLQIEEPVTGRVRNYPTAFNQSVVRASALNCSHHSISANKHYIGFYVPVYGSLAMDAFLFFSACIFEGYLVDQVFWCEKKSDINESILRFYLHAIYIFSQICIKYCVLLSEMKSKHLSTYISNCLLKYFLFIKKKHVLAYTCNPNTSKVEAGRLLCI